MTSSNIVSTIQRASADDAQTLATLGAATFTETFGHLYSSKDLQVFLEEAHSVETWARKLADPEVAVWLSMREDNEPIGFISVGRCKLPVENFEVTAGEIHQLYVLARYHNLRLGSRLMKTGLEWLDAQNRSPLYVGVWSENSGAQRFYGRYGFTKVGEYGFPVGDTVDREYILKK